MSHRDELLAVIRDYDADLRRVALSARAAGLIGQVMLELTQDLDYAAAGGLTIRADPIATAMMHVAGARGDNLDAFVVREAGTAHGMQQPIEGPEIAGRRVLLVADTCTTGDSVRAALHAVRAAGAIPVAVAVVADRGTGAREKIEAEGVEYRAAYRRHDLEVRAA
ncbi:orotate phosphoribosyltransferase [Dactylosporangium sp. NPDC051541]|uniref:orotate phosphoribosyltransferase n=1 Tax=Dactylosporangium sp. NPDC051541 TaxID=3363977 RepID=UPI00378CF51B